MKFNLPDSVTPPFGSELRIGNVYKCHGGGKTRFWIVMGFDDRSVQLLGINKDGVVTSATTYGVHVFWPSSTFKIRLPVGFCAGIEELEFNIEWCPE